MINSLQDLVQKLKPYLRAEFLDVDTMLRGGGPYHAPWVPLTAVTQPITVNMSFVWAPIPRDMVPIQFSVLVSTGTPNSSANFWTISLAPTSASVNTSALGAGTGAILTTTSFGTSLLTPASLLLRVDIAKTGAPGAIYIAPDFVGV